MKLYRSVEGRAFWQLKANLWADKRATDFAVLESEFNAGHWNNFDFVFLSAGNGEELPKNFLKFREESGKLQLCS